MFKARIRKSCWFLEVPEIVYLNEPMRSLLQTESAMFSYNSYIVEKNFLKTSLYNYVKTVTLENNKL